MIRNQSLLRLCADTVAFRLGQRRRRLPSSSTASLLCWNHHHHYACQGVTRTLASSTSNTSTHSTSRKRRAKSLSASPNTKTTTRERLRSIVERNELVSRNHHSNKNNREAEAVKDLVSVATQRLSWLQTKIFQHWNPDYQSATDQAATAGAEASSKKGNGGPAAAAAVQELIQRKRSSVVMDRRWWFWNLAFALLPVAVITAYCELRVKPYMEDFYQQQTEAQQQRAMGITTIEDNDDNDKAHINQQSFMERFSDAWKEIQAVLGGTADDNEKDAKTTSSSSAKGDKEQVPSISSTPSLSAETQRRQHFQEQQQQQDGNNVKQRASQDENASSSVKEEVTLQTLAQRIEHLERLLENKLADEKKNSQQAQQHQQQQQQQQPHWVQQKSGIRARIDKKILEAMQNENMAKSETDDKNKASDGLPSALWNSFSSRWDQLMSQLQQSTIESKSEEVPESKNNEQVGSNTTTDTATTEADSKQFPDAEKEKSKKQQYTGNQEVDEDSPSSAQTTLKERKKWWAIW